MDDEQRLDAMPDDGLDAAALLEQLAVIAHRAGLVRMERRLRAVGKWATSVAMADMELLHEQAETESLEREVLAAPPRPMETTADARERRVLAALQKHVGGIGPTRLAAEVGFSKATLLNVLKPLVRAKRVAQTDIGRRTRYGPVKEGL